MGNSTYFNFSTIICCLLFTILLSFIYFSKKNMNNIDNKVYKQLLLWNYIELFSTLLGQIMIFRDNPSGFIFALKLYFSSTCCWLLCLLLYTIIVTNEERKNIYDFFNSKKPLFLFFAFVIVIYTLEILLPIDDYKLVNGELSEMYGYSVYLYYGFITFSLIGALISTFLNRKKVKSKRLLPFYLTFIFCVITLIFYIMVPQYIVLQLFFTLVIYLMFFTIENPDLKLVNELTLAKNEAEKAANAKSDFLSSMSHELRTPLNAIIGLTQLIDEEDSINEIKKDNRDVRIASEKLLELVESILSINTIDSNNVEVVNEEYSIRELIDNVNTIAKSRIGSKEIDYKVSISNDVPDCLYGDRLKIRTIILNLVSNAIKYTDSGCVQLDIDCFINRDKCNLRITVSDTGCGISDDELNHIFEKFYRSVEKRDSAISGTGLGLSITKSLIDLMDGKIIVDSNLNNGSTFTVTLNQGIVNKEVENTEIL